MNELKIACLQMSSGEDPSANFEQLKSLIEGLVEGEVDLVCTPENSLYLRIDQSKPMFYFSQESQQIQQVAQLATQKKMDIILGSVPWEQGGQKLNATLFVTRSGQVEVVYTKSHLFDVAVEGVSVLQESDDFEAGETPIILEYMGWKIGLSICYDLRFSNLYKVYADQAVDLVLVPAAFLRKTGQAHWSVLQRARAIECQAYVVSAAQAGCHRNSEGKTRWSYGHSIVVGPWGEVLSEGPAEEIWLSHVRLSKKVIEKTRQQIPMHLHRKVLKKAKIIKP